MKALTITGHGDSSNLRYRDDLAVPRVQRGTDVRIRVQAAARQSLQTLREFMTDRRFGAASARVVIEELLSGPELSFMVVTDGQTVVPLATSQDHKRLLEGDEGPNTGGMGAVTPSPHATVRLRAALLAEVVEPVLAELRRRQIAYRGFLYAGVMLTPEGPRVLEFNVRLGDPETQALLFGMRGELGPVLAAAARGELDERMALEDSVPACCVVLAAGGYPSAPQKGDAVSGLDLPLDAETFVFHAGTREEDGRLVTAGRVAAALPRDGPAARCTGRRPPGALLTDRDAADRRIGSRAGAACELPAAEAAAAASVRVGVLMAFSWVGWG